MSRNVSCPECNSQDVQEIVKTKQLVTSVRNWKMFWLILGGGIVFLLTLSGISDAIGSDGLIGLGAVIFVLSIPTSIIILIRGKANLETENHIHYVCRACGWEFHIN